MFSKLYRQFANTEIYRRILFQQANRPRTNAYFIQVDPKEIKNFCLIPESSTSLRGGAAVIGISGGVWDHLKIPYKDHYLYKTVAKILDGTGFENTELFQKVSKGKITEAEAKRLFEKVNGIIKILSNEKYKSQYELHKFDQKLRIGSIRIPYHEMVVGMDRNGELMRMIGGKHRLAVAQLLDLDSMYAILGFIHEKSELKLPVRSRVITGKNEDFRPF